MDMEQAGQTFDFLLYATLTSGTTRENQNYQSDYLLTMEMIKVRTGDYDKQSATLTKGYYQTRLGRLLRGGRVLSRLLLQRLGVVHQACGE